jgi:1-acyl-sn-glycerol-3-phosphate acyltransferase
MPTTDAASLVERAPDAPRSRSLATRLLIAVRFVWMWGELSFAAVTWVGFCLFRPKSRALAVRTHWLQYSCRRFLRIFGIRYRAIGPVPQHGLLVSNHLTYMDVLVLAAIKPAVFVSKKEVSRWPVFGWFTRIAGTIYVERERRSQVGRVTDEIQSALDAGALVVIFPEGTSSDGKTVLPLKTSLLEPAARQTAPLHVSLIQYEMEDGDVTEEVCYWRDMTFFPHLVNMLGKRGVHATVRFSEFRETGLDRKELARRLHAELLRLKDSIKAKPARECVNADQK